MFKNDYGGVIWTNHALDRLKERGVSQGDAWVAFQKPDQSRPGSAPGSWIYYKTFNGWKLEVVAKQNEQKQWVILSVWGKPDYQNPSRKQNPFIRFLRWLFFSRY